MPGIIAGALDTLKKDLEQPFILWASLGTILSVYLPTEYKGIAYPTALVGITALGDLRAKLDPIANPLAAVTFAWVGYSILSN